VEGKTEQGGGRKVEYPDMKTPEEELEKLQVMTVREAIGLFAKRKEQGQAQPSVLIETAEFIGLLEALFHFKVAAKTLKTYASPRVNLLPPAVKKNGKSCYVYPDQLDRIGFILTLRGAYHLPLNTIRELDKHFPADARHLVLERKMTIEELLDLAKMLPRGFAVRDLVMAKTCDLMVQDTLSPSKALFAAVEPGEALRKTEESAILSRLDELKQWVLSGRRQEFVRRESAEDFKNLAFNRLLAGKIVKKITAKRARHR
jgi:DNA-binding transcriptional MerR regulator